METVRVLWETVEQKGSLNAVCEQLKPSERVLPEDAPKLMENRIIEVESLAARLHGKAALALVRFCYDSRIRLHVQGDVPDLMRLLENLLIERHHFPAEVAQRTIVELFPTENGQHHFIYDGRTP